MSNEELVREIQSGHNEKENIETLLQQNNGMIYKTCRKYANNDYGIDMDDLLQESALAIYEAISKYDASKGASFITYYIYWIELYLRRYVYKSDIIYTKSQKEYVLRYKRFCEAYYKEFGTCPDDMESASYLQVSPRKIQKIKEACIQSSVLSLDYDYESDKDGDSYSLEAGEEDRNLEEVEHRANNEALRACEERCLANLPADQRDAIRQKYLNGEKKYNDKRLKSLVQVGMSNIRHNHKALNELSTYIDWIDARAYRVGFRAWKRGRGIDALAIERAYTNERIEALQRYLI